MGKLFAEGVALTLSPVRQVSFDAIPGMAKRLASVAQVRLADADATSGNGRPAAVELPQHSAEGPELG